MTNIIINLFLRPDRLKKLQFFKQSYQQKCMTNILIRETFTQPYFDVKECYKLIPYTYLYNNTQ